MPLLAALLLALSVPGSDPLVGEWRAVLESPGGELPFGIEVERHEGSLRAWLVNGSERIDVPRTSWSEGEALFDMPHYDSRLTARLAGERLVGTWRKRRGASTWTEMGFTADKGARPRFEPASAPSDGDSVDGRWRVRFESSEDDAVALFSTGAGGEVEGTFLTTTGDYRFLAGDFAGGELRLSCFDGAHAFLFTAELLADGSLRGDFWSRDTWHEGWTAVRDDAAALPDAFEQTVWNEGWSLGDVMFPDLEGRPRSLADPEFAGRARILQVFGSWCPNCNDEARYLSGLLDEYGPHGLSVLGIAFELTGDFERDTQQVRRYLERNRVDYPVLVAGTADKRGATRAFPALDFVRSYPTTIFLHRDGRVRAVHSGFTGPATGAAFDELRVEFEGLIEELLAEPAESIEPYWSFLDDREFTELLGSRAGRRLRFERDGDRLSALVAGGESAPLRRPVHASGGSVLFGDEVLRMDVAADALLDPRDVGRRWAADAHWFERRSADEWLAATEAPSGAARREALIAHVLLRVAERRGDGGVLLAHLDDESLHAELAAVWGAGRLHVEEAREPLRARLTDPNAAVRREAARALGELGPDEADRTALAALGEDPDPLVRRVAGDALARIEAGARR